MARNYKSIAEPKALTADASSSATQITLNNVTGLPSPPYVLVINPDTVKEEAVLVTVDQTGVTSPTLKVSRAIETGATAQDHTTGHIVRHMIVGSDLQLAHDHIDNTSAHDATGGVVGLTKTQTLTNKTINLTSNTLTGTTAQFNTALSDADFATTALLEARVPVGAVNMWVTGTAPTGWLLCDGSAVSRTTYSALWDVLRAGGSTSLYGNGDGSTTFNLPDLLGRVPMGAGAGTGLTSRALGTKLGAESVTLTAAQSGLPQHSHPNTLSDPGHSHTIDPPNVHSALAANWGSRYGAPEVAYRQDYGQTIFPSVTGVTINNANAGPSAASEAHTNTQPSTVINFIIKF